MAIALGLQCINQDAPRLTTCCASLEANPPVTDTTTPICSPKNIRATCCISSWRLLAGCGGSQPFPRVDFPKQPGNYLQFYTQFGHPVVEFVQVGQRGEAHSVQSDIWHGKVSA